MIIAPSVQTLWTDRDLDIVETLVLKVRMMTTKQVANFYWPDSTSKNEYALRRLRKLTRAGLLRCYDVNVHPLLQLEKALWVWQPGWPVPDFEQLAYEAQARWTKPTVSKSIYIASPQAVYLFAGYGRGKLGSMFQWTHDLHMAEIYSCFKSNRPDEFDYWVGEDGLPKPPQGEKRPDAFVVVDDLPMRAVDFIGSYDASRLQSLHTHCEERELPYELW